MAPLGRNSLTRARLAAFLVFGLTLFFFCKTFHCSPPVELPHNPLKSSCDDLRESYDYIVVGGGQSGLTVANRLSEDGKSMTLLQRQFRYSLLTRLCDQARY